MAEEFRKVICELLVSNLKERYLVKVLLIFNYWLKDIVVCIVESKLIDLELVQVFQDYTINHARGAMESYFAINSMLKY